MYPHPKHGPARSTLQGTVLPALVVGLLLPVLLTGCSSKTPTNSAASPPPPPPSPQAVLAQKCGHIPEIANALENCRDSPDYSPQGMYQRCKVGHDGIKSLKSIMPLALSQSERVCEVARNLYSMKNERMVAPMRQMGYSDTYIEAHFAEKLAENERGCASAVEKGECVDIAAPIIADMFAATKAKLEAAEPVKPAEAPPAAPEPREQGMRLGPNGLNILEAHPKARAQEADLRRIFAGYDLRTRMHGDEGIEWRIYEIRKGRKLHVSIDEGPSIQDVLVHSPEVEGPQGARVGMRFEELPNRAALTCHQGEGDFTDQAICTTPQSGVVQFLFDLEFHPDFNHDGVPDKALQGRKLKAMRWYKSDL